MPSAATILRRRYPYLTPPFVPDDDEEWGKRPRPPVLAPPQLPPLVRPVEMSGPVIEPLPPTVDLGIPTTVPIDSNIPLTITRKGRPAILPNLRPEDAARGQQQYTQAVRDYQPREEGWGKGLLRAGLGFLRGGIPGAVGTLGTWALDRRATDRNWREGELERSQQAEGMMADERRRGLQDRMLQLQLNRAENPPADYDWMPNPADPQGSDVYAPLKPGLVRPLRTKPSERRGFNLSPGQKRWEIGPDGKPVLIAESPDRPARELPDTQFTNDQLQQNIRTAAEEQVKVEQALRDTAPTLSRPGQFAGDPPIVTRNPVYEDLENRRDKLIDDQRRWRADMKPGRDIGDPVEQRIREAAKAKGLDPERAVQMYRSGKY